jgi:hypothetical protein
MNFKPVKLIFTSLLFVFVNSLAFSQSSPNSVTFTKKEIAFLNWGKGPKEVSLGKDEFMGNEGSKVINYDYPRQLWVDGNGNLYFLDRCRDDKRIFVVSADGQSIKTIEFDKTGGIADVDEDGNIYALKLGGFILTRPDGTQRTYDNFNFFEVVDGVVYDRMHQQAVTIADHGNEPEKFTPRLFASDIGYKDLKSFTIRSSKINEHLKKINRHLDVDSIHIKVNSRNDLGYANFIGVDDDGLAYCLYSYTLNNISGPFEEADVVVYSQLGQEIGRFQLPLRDFDKQIDINSIFLDIHGNIYQMLASEDGLHLLKWQKN